MMKRLTLLLFTLLLLATDASFREAGAQEIDTNSPDMAWWREAQLTKDERLAWWREARFGCFIHWGVYSELGGVWKGKPVRGYAEHIQRSQKIPQDVYRQEAVEKFNPAKFDADEWVRTIKQAGMKYLIITAKHHDGFAMYDSKVSPYNIVEATPFKRDPMRELKEACDRHGIRFGFYYSHAFDWGDPNGPGNDWEWENPGGDRNLFGGRAWYDEHPKMVERIRKNYVDKKSIPQIKELITQYQPDIMWFDTPHKLSIKENIRILRAVRQTDPNVVVNGRLVRSPELNMGDYLNTCDRPAEITPQEGDWEAIPTTNESYGYHQADLRHKNPEHFVQLLVKAVARGGNLLMNLGPRGDGTFDTKDIEILQGISSWMQTNSESIHGAERTPLPVQAWGESTLKGNQLYLHVFQWPTKGQLVVGGLDSDPQSAMLLTADGEKPLTFQRIGKHDLQLKVPAEAPFAADSVIMLKFADTLATDRTRRIDPAVSVNELHVYDGQISHGLRYSAGKSHQDHVLNWKKKSDTVSWNCRLAEPVEVEVAVTYEADPSTRGKFVVELAGQQLTGEVANSKGEPVVLGRMKLPAGEVPVVVKAIKITGKELMHLRSVRLVPVD